MGKDSFWNKSYHSRGCGFLCLTFILSRWYVPRERLVEECHSEYPEADEDCRPIIRVMKTITAPNHHKHPANRDTSY